MVNNEMSEDMLGETGDGSGDCTETSATSSDSHPKSESSPSAKEADEPAGSADENVRLSPTSLFCSVPLNRDVQTIIDTFPKTEAEKAGKKTRKIPCLYCDRTFVADNLRQKHVERSHSIKQARRSSSRFQQSIATVTCLFCNKFTLTENKLNDLFQHLVTAHPTKYFGCLPCQERFASSTQLEEHNDHTHGITREVKVQSTEEVSDTKTNSAITDSSVVKTRHKAKIKDESEQSDETKPVLRRGRQQVLQKELKHKKIAIKSTKLGIKRSVRLQTKVVPNKGKKRPKPKERVVEEPKLEKDKEVKVSSTENPYPTFDAFYRVKKITDHSIDNLRITSLTFNDVFDQAFYTRIKCNIRENLLNHLDGKLFKNEESESRISNFEKTQPEFPTSENYGCEISLNAATPVAASLLTAQFGDDPESQIEYGSKASKKKSTPKQDEVHYKYFTRRKYQASILESKENRDLSKLDMWTQLVIKRRQQKILQETKSDREKLDYKKGEEYRAKKQNQELNRILDRRGPFEDLKEEANKKAALEGNFNQEAHSDVTFILDDILGSVFSKVIEDVEIKTELTDSEIPSYLNLRKASLTNESYVDKSDKITLICSSQETENFEAADILPKDKNALVELTGEWARSRLYICAACGLKMANIKSLIDHKNLIHQNVWCQHYEFVGNQGEFYRHLSIPGLGKMERIETNCTYKVWKRSEARVCTKCNKQCNSLGELHRHVLECGEDWSWMLVRKKCKYKPFGAKTRKKRRGLFKRIIQKDKPADENREKKTYKKEGPRVKPSDADTIQRMLANLPAKRATRKIMSLKDGFPKISRKTNYKKKTPETLNNKVVNIKSKKQNMQMRRDRGEILVQDTQTVLKGKRRLMKCNPVNNIRKSMRNLNKVISSAIIDNNSTLLVKRKLNAIKKQRLTRRSQQSLEEPLIPKESNEEEAKKPNKKSPVKKKPVEVEVINEKEDEFPVRSTRSTSSLPDLEEAKLESPVKKKNKFGKKLMRTLSLRRNDKPSTNNKKQTATLDTENTKNNGKRKSKLETFKNAVKKIRLVKENLRSQKQSGEVVGGHFLEEGASRTAAETVTPELCSEKENDSEKQIETPAPVEVGVSVSETPAEEEERIEKVTCDKISAEETETAVSACDPVTQVSEVCEETSVTVKPEKVSVIPKTKLCKRNKGLNACIAMLTSKLQQKEVEAPLNLKVTEPIITETSVKIKEEVPEVNDTLEPVDQNKPQPEISTEEAAVPEKSPEILKTSAPVEEKENIVLEQKPVEQNSPKKEEVRTEKVVDIIKCFDDINSKENINGHNKKQQKKPGKKVGGNKKKPVKAKLNLINDNVIPSVEEQLNTAILEEDNNEVQKDVTVRKLGQRRTLPKRSTKTKQSDVVEIEKPTDVVDDVTTAPKPESSKSVELPVKSDVKKLIKEPKLILDSNFKIQTPINFTEAKELKTLIQPVFSFPNTKPPEAQNFPNLRTPNILNFPNPKPADPIIKPPILKDVFTFNEPKLSESKAHMIIKPPIMKDIFGFNSEIKQPVIKSLLNRCEKTDLIKSPVLKDVFAFPEHRTSDLMAAKLFNPLQKINGLTKPRSQSFGVFDKPDKPLNTSLPNLQTNLDEPDVLENKSFAKQKLSSDSEDEIPLAVLAKEVLQVPKLAAPQKESKNTVLQIPTVKTKDNKPNVVLQIPTIKSKTAIKQNDDSGVELTPKEQSMVSEKDIIQSFADFIKQSNVMCTRNLFADSAEPDVDQSIINNSVTDLVTTRFPQKEKKKGKKKGKLKKQFSDDFEENFMEHKSLLEAENAQKKKSKKKRNINDKLDDIIPEAIDMTKKIEVNNDNQNIKISEKTQGENAHIPYINTLPESILNKRNENKLPQINRVCGENEERYLPEDIEGRLIANNIEIRLVPINNEDKIISQKNEPTPINTEGIIYCNKNEYAKTIEITQLLEPNQSADDLPQNLTIAEENILPKQIKEKSQITSDVFRKPEPIITKITIPKIHLTQKPEAVSLENVSECEKSRTSRKKDNTSPKHRKGKKVETIIDADDEILQIEEENLCSVQAEDLTGTRKKRKDKASIFDKDLTTKSADIEECIASLKRKKNKMLHANNEESFIASTFEDTPINSDTDNNLKSTGILDIHSEKKTEINVETVIVDNKQNSPIISDVDTSLKMLPIEENLKAKINNEEILQFEGNLLTQPNIMDKSIVSNQEKDLKLIDVDDTKAKSKKRKSKMSVDEVDIGKPLDEGGDKQQSEIDNEDLISGEEIKEAEEEPAKVTKLVIDKRKLINFEPKKFKTKKTVEIIPSTTELDFNHEKLITTMSEEDNSINRVEDKSIMQEIQKEDVVISQNQIFSMDVNTIPSLTSQEDNNDNTFNAETSEEFVPQEESNEVTTALEKVSSRGKKQKNLVKTSEEIITIEQNEDLSSDGKFVKIRQQKVKKSQYNEDIIDTDENNQSELKIENCEDTFVKIRRQKAKKIDTTDQKNEIIEGEIVQNNVEPELQKISRGRKQKNKKINYNEDAQFDAVITSKLDSLEQNHTDEDSPVKTTLKGRKMKNKKINYNEEAGVLLDSKNLDQENHSNDIELDDSRSRPLSRGRKQKNKKINYNEDLQVLEELSNPNDMEKLTPKGRRQKNRKINYIDEPEGFLEFDIEKQDSQINNSFGNNEVDLVKRGRKQKNRKTNYITEPEDLSLFDSETPSSLGDNNQETLLDSNITTITDDQHENVEQHDAENPTMIDDNKNISSTTVTTELELNIKEPEEMLPKTDEISFSIANIVQTTDERKENDKINFIEKPEQSEIETNVEDSNLKKLPLRGRKQKNRKINYIEEPEDVPQFDSKIGNIEENTNDDVQKSTLRGRRQKKINYIEESEDNENLPNKEDNNQEILSPELENVALSSKGRKQKNKKINLQKSEVEEVLDAESNKLVEEIKEVTEPQKNRPVSRGRKQKNKKINYSEEVFDFDLDDSTKVVSSVQNLEQISNDGQNLTPKTRKEKNKKINYMQEPEDVTQVNLEIPSNTYENKQIDDEILESKKQNNKKTNNREDLEESNTEQLSDCNETTSIVDIEETLKTTAEVRPVSRSRKQKTKQINYNEEILDESKTPSKIIDNIPLSNEESILSNVISPSLSRGRKQKNKKINYNEEAEDFLQITIEATSNIDSSNQSMYSNTNNEGSTNDEAPSVLKGRKQKNKKNYDELNLEETSVQKRDRKQKNKKINYNEEFGDLEDLSNTQTISSVTNNEIQQLTPKEKKQKTKKHNFNQEFEEFLQSESENCSLTSCEGTRSRNQKAKKVNYEEISNEDIPPSNIEESNEENESPLRGRKQKNKKINYNEDDLLNIDSKEFNDNEIKSPVSEEVIQTKAKKQRMKKSKHAGEELNVCNDKSLDDNLLIPVNLENKSKKQKVEDEALQFYSFEKNKESMETEVLKSNIVADYDEISLDEMPPIRKYNEVECNILSNNENKFTFEKITPTRSNYSMENLTQSAGNNGSIISAYDEISSEEFRVNDYDKNSNQSVMLKEINKLSPKGGNVRDGIIEYEEVSLEDTIPKGDQSGMVLGYDEISLDEIIVKTKTDENVNTFIDERNTFLKDREEFPKDNIDEYNIDKFMKGNNSEEISGVENKTSFEETGSIFPSYNSSVNEVKSMLKSTEYEEVSLKTNQLPDYNQSADYEISIPKGRRKQNNTKPMEKTTRSPSERSEINTTVFEFNENFENNSWKLNDERTKHDQNTNHHSNTPTHLEDGQWTRNKCDDDDLNTKQKSNNQWNDATEENPRIETQVNTISCLDDSSDNSSDAEPLIKIIDKMAVASNKSGLKMNIPNLSDKYLEDTELPLKIVKHPDDNLQSSKCEEDVIPIKSKDEAGIFDFEEKFTQQVLHSSSKLAESDGEDAVITIGSDEDDDDEDDDEPITISDVSDNKNESSSIVSDNSKENHVINSGKSKPADTSTSSIDESVEAFELPNDTNKINSKLKIKSSKKKKGKNLKKKDRHISTPDNYCDICDKKFVRSDSLIKHKRTLTHIAKLSEIEAREAEERAKKEEKEDIQKSILVPSPFSLKTNNDTLKLADIISDVLNKPVPEDNIDTFNEMQETKRYKSLGERKSFDSDSIMFNPPKSTFTNHINMSNKLPHSTGAFLETQISLLENIIENKTNFQYIDEISNKSDERCSSDMSLVSDIKQDDSNIISFSHNTSIVSSIIHSDTNFVKPSQYEEISEDTRNFDEQRARKALNRDEELFLECCSLLKSSSEVSDYSKKSAKTISMVSTYGLKPGEETGWLQHKNMIAKQKAFANNDEYLSDNSRPDTPIGDNYDDFSNSNTIRTEWNSKMKEGEFEDISLDSLTNSENNSNFNSFGMNFNEGNEGNGNVPQKPDEDDAKSNDDLMEDDLEIIDDDDDDADDEEGDLDAVEISENVKSSTEIPQPPTVTYTVPLPKKSDGDSSTNDSKKVMTKGAMKVFEGLKVSIPTEELDMSEVLNCSPTTKRQDLEPPADPSKEDQLETLEKSQKDNLNRFGNKLGLKIVKKRVKPRASQERKLEEDNKVHDIYDFEETQDNTDLFIPNNLKTFRSQLAEKKVEDKEAESDLDSNNHYVDSFSVEAQSVSSFSTETESSLSMKKNTGAKNITKKKCVIMGRIFKNAFKAKTDEIKNIPVIENVKLVENYVMNCPNIAADGKPVNEERIKMTEQEMDILFDKLLEDNELTNKEKLVVGENIGPPARSQGKGRPKGSKQKKRVRKQSQSSDDEFNLSKTPKKRTARKKVKDNGINLEQELKECMGVAGRKSQRKCTSGKQNVLVEDWSSDDSEFEAMLRQSIQQSKTTSKNKEKVKETPPVVTEPPTQTPPTVTVTAPEKPVVEKATAEPISEEFLKEIVKDVNEAKPKPRRKSTAKKDKEDRLPKIKTGTIESTLASNRRKRAAADTLYYWSSSSDDDSQNLIEVKSVRDEIDEDDDRPMQHGWIVGDSPKKLVTMLAQAKGKKIDTKCVKEQSKKRTTL